MIGRKHNYKFPVVGIGASAGGVEAMENFFRNMPENSGLAFVVVQHLDPSRKGLLPEVLQKFTAMKVSQAADGEDIKPDCVYVIPSNKTLSLMDGKLLLFDPIEKSHQKLYIDTFFRSLAMERREHSIGVILSGMGSDGSLGIKAIKENNGMVIVQTPADAKFESMPVNAIDSVNPDIVAPAKEIPGRMLSLLKLFPIAKTITIIDEAKRGDLNKIIILVRERTGHDFSQYKKSTLYRRIERRMGIHQIEKINNYVRYLQENSIEIDILFKELLIGVTNFFRDTQLWDTLKEKILPELISRVPDNQTLRLWVPGCSTGEEVFSWAIVLKEVLDSLHKKIYIQIFGTDIDENAVNFARRAIYLKNINNDISPERLKRFFVKEGESYRIKDFIRELVVFAVHNVIKHPPFTKLDILSCRNMLIYMEPELQKSMISLFNYSMKPSGLLILGTSETIGQSSLFKEIDTKLKIYKHSMSSPRQGLLEISQLNQPMEQTKKTEQENDDNIQSAAEKIILKSYAPPSVLVNDKGDILYLSGKTGKFLEPVTGKANWNIHAMAKEGLRQELLMAFRKALSSLHPIVVPNIKVGNGLESFNIKLSVERLEKPEAVKGLIFIVFNEEHERPKKNQVSRKSGPSEREKELEHELRMSYEDLQSITEEMQASQEELKATNEELQSTNEELQSTNEELTTSKEEMQSMNEELQTVNYELQNKVLEFSQAENDMKNLLNSTEIATLFLDKQLNIRRFTDTVKNIIKLRKTDIGRPLTDISTDLQYPDIEKDAQRVLDTLISMENPIRTHDSRWFNVRMMPYRSADDHIEGIVITFTDITVYKELEIELELAREKLKNAGLHS